MLLTPATIKHLRAAVQNLQDTLTSMDQEIEQRNCEIYPCSYIIDG